MHVRVVWCNDTRISLTVFVSASAAAISPRVYVCVRVRAGVRVAGSHRIRARCVYEDTGRIAGSLGPTLRWTRLGRAPSPDAVLRLTPFRAARAEGVRAPSSLSGARGRYDTRGPDRADSARTVGRHTAKDRRQEPHRAAGAAPLSGAARKMDDWQDAAAFRETACEQ